MSANWFRTLPVAAIAAVAPASAGATVYLTIPAAQQALFPGAQFAEHPLALSDDQRKAIARAAGGTRVHSRAPDPAPGRSSHENHDRMRDKTQNTGRMKIEK